MASVFWETPLYTQAVVRSIRTAPNSISSMLFLTWVLRWNDGFLPLSPSLSPKRKAAMRQPYYLKRRKCWYVWIDGKQERLDPDKKQAFDKFHKLMSNDEINGEVSVAKLLDASLDWMQKHRSAKTFSWYRDHLISFAKSIGAGLKITDLRPFHVTDWLDAKEWSNNTKHRAIAAIQRVFNWGRKQGYIVRSPLEGMEKPEVTPRDVLITDAHFKTLMEETKDQAGRDFWSFLWETGCRVQEARIIHTDHFQRDEMRLVIPRKNAKGKKKARVIYLNPVAFEIVDRRVKAQGEGFILRHSRGKQWTKETVKNRVQRFLKPLSDEYNATAFRHTFCTRALMSGVDPITVSELMGHSNLNMVANNYGHLCKKPMFLHEQLKKIA